VPRRALVIGPAERRLVLVSGPPGSGKTTIAGPLAAELGFALLAKDRIKETLHDWLAEDEPDLGWSRRLGAASMELLWALAADAPAVVLEANFWPDDARVGRRLAALADRPVEVFCKCPAPEYRRRYAERASSRHVVHVDSHHLQLPDEAFTRSDRPVGLGVVLTVDTTTPVDIPALAREVLEQLGGPPGPAVAGPAVAGPAVVGPAVGGPPVTGPAVQLRGRAPLAAPHQP
jgi:predicted kinase